MLDDIAQHYSNSKSGSGSHLDFNATYAFITSKTSGF